MIILHARLIAYCALFASIIAESTGECKPVTWSNPGQIVQHSTVTDRPSDPVPTRPTIVYLHEDIKPGDVNCRAWSFRTGEKVGCCTCRELGNKYELSKEKFFLLNPELKPDCSNIKPNTKYCIDGFIEPVRAIDGFCGPNHNNATCIGSKFGSCCNANTFKCGQTEEDCAPGTCYEGACPGDKVYSTDGTCGYYHGNRLCAGKWGECCNFDGKCGSGESFCGMDSCQSGKCIRPFIDHGPLPWLVGNTTEGQCGGPERYTCSVVYGNCCNKHGQCGSLPEDCGEGCQSEFGKCGSEPAIPTLMPNPFLRSQSSVQKVPLEPSEDHK